MSVVHLVRHGQASFGRSDYDRLSERGETQAVVLGRAFAARGVRPQQVVSGTMRRQHVTAARMWDAAGWEAPVTTDAGWNEYDHDAIIEAYRPAYRNKNVLRADLARHRHPRRAFQEMFLDASSRWIGGRHDDDYPETFDAFRDRVALALGRLTTNLASGQVAVVVTSGGPMSWVAASLLTNPAPAAGSGRSLTIPAAAPPGSREVWTNLSRVVVNTGVTTVLHGNRLSLLTTNDHAHLLTPPDGSTPDPELVTYR